MPPLEGAPVSMVAAFAASRDFPPMAEGGKTKVGAIARVAVLTHAAVEAHAVMDT